MDDNDNHEHAVDCKTCERCRTCKDWRACLVYEPVGTYRCWRTYLVCEPTGGAGLCDEYRPISGKPGPRIDIET